MYPESPSANVQVTDAVIDDLDADGVPEVYVALGGREIHRVDGRGQRVWMLDSFRDISSFTVSHDQSGQRYLLVAHDGRHVTPLNTDGDQFESITLDQTVVQLLASARPAVDGSFCAVCQPADGQSFVVGLDASFKETWRRALPNAIVNASQRIVHWVPWTANGQQGMWLIQTAADQLLIVSEDGTTAKSLSMRFPLRVAIGTADGNGNLLIGAVEGSVMAWRIQL